MVLLKPFILPPSWELKKQVSARLFHCPTRVECIVTSGGMCGETQEPAENTIHMLVNGLSYSLRGFPLWTLPKVRQRHANMAKGKTYFSDALKISNNYDEIKILKVKTEWKKRLLNISHKKSRKIHFIPKEILHEILRKPNNFKEFLIPACLLLSIRSYCRLICRC